MKKTNIILIASTLTLLIFTSVNAQNTTIQDYRDNMKLSWSDEFEGDSLDFDNWMIEPSTTHRNQQQYIVNDARENNKNLKVEDGKLYLTATDDGQTCEHANHELMTEAEHIAKYGIPTATKYSSISIESLKKQQFRYGLVEARIKGPTGKGLWSGVWFCGYDPVAGKARWPWTGEIDLAEFLSTKSTEYFATLHYQDPTSEAMKNKSAAAGVYTLPNGGTMDGDFHTVGMMWTDTYFSFYIDDYIYNTIDITDPEFDAFRNYDFYFILSNSLGGALGAEIDAEFPQSFILDYVRVYQPYDANIEAVSDSSVTVTPREGYEYSIDGVNWQNENVFSNLTQGAQYNVYQRLVKSNVFGASSSSNPVAVVPGNRNLHLTDTTGSIATNYKAFNAHLTASDSLDGTLFAALYDENDHLISIKQYQAAADIDVSFEKDGKYTKTMWWQNSTFTPYISYMQLNNKAPEVYPCTDLNLVTQSIDFTKALPVQIKTSLLPENTTDYLVYSSDDTEIADVNSHGLVTPKKDGTCNISVRCGSFTKTLPVTVNVDFSAKILPRNDNLVFDTNKSQTILYDLVNFAGNELPAFSSSSNSIATVSSSGVVTPKSVGTCTITLTLNGVTATVNVTSNVAPCTEMFISLDGGTTWKNNKTQSISYNDTNIHQIKIATNPYGKCTDNIACTTSDSDILAISTVKADAALSNKKQGYVNVIPKANGTAVLTFTASTYTIALSVTVSATTISCEDISLTTSALNFTTTDAQTIAYTLTPGDTTEIVSFSSSDTSVATVTSSGKVTPIADGECTINVVCGNCSKVVTVTVDLPQIEWVTVADDSNYAIDPSEKLVLDSYTGQPVATQWNIGWTDYIPANIGDSFMISCINTKDLGAKTVYCFDADKNFLGTYQSGNTIGTYSINNGIGRYDFSKYVSGVSTPDYKFEIVNNGVFATTAYIRVCSYSVANYPFYVKKAMIQ